MTKDDLKNGLANVHDRLGELETRARKLQNQNFADIVAGAKGRVQQLMEHPDLENVADDVQQEGTPFDPTAGKPAPDFTPKYDPAVRSVPAADLPNHFSGSDLSHAPGAGQSPPAALTTGVVAAPVGGGALPGVAAAPVDGETLPGVQV